MKFSKPREFSFKAYLKEGRLNRQVCIDRQMIEFYDIEDNTYCNYV